jgi:hypothetical protein
MGDFMSTTTIASTPVATSSSSVWAKIAGALQRQLRVYRHKVSVLLWSALMLSALVPEMQKLGKWETDWNGVRQLSYHSAISFLALLFPLSAILFVLFNVVARREQVEDAADRIDLPIIYFPASDDAQTDFAQLLRARFRESCNGLELALMSLMAGTLAFLALYFFLENLVPAGQQSLALLVPGPRLDMIMAGFFGAYAGSLVTILRKYRTLDIYPSTYFQSAVALLLGLLIGTFLASMFSTWAVSLVLALSFIAAANVNVLGGFLRSWLGKQTGFVVQEPITGDLQSVIKNSEAIESLHTMSVYSIAELVTSDPLLIYLNLPQPIGVINGWIDEALLLDHFDADHALIQQQNVRRFTELLHQLIAWPADRNKTLTLSDLKILTDQEITKDNLANERIRSRMYAVLTSQLHHRLLAILSRPYRETFFGSSK